MTLNGVMAIILPYFAEFGSFRGQLPKWLISHQQIFSREMSHSIPTKHDGRAVLFAVVELLVIIIRSLSYQCAGNIWFE